MSSSTQKKVKSAILSHPRNMFNVFPIHSPIVYLAEIPMGVSLLHRRLDELSDMSAFSAVHLLPMTRWQCASFLFRPTTMLRPARFLLHSGYL
jgi:hypothetical protein